MSITFNKILNQYKEAYSDHPREVWYMAILTFINRMGTMVIPFLTVYMTTILGFTDIQAGICMSFFGLGMMCGSFISGKISEIIDSNWVVIMSLICSSICFVLLQFFTTFPSMCVMIFIASMFGEAYRPAMMVSLGRVVHKSKMGRTSSLIRLAINLGMAAGPLIGGYIAYNISYTGLFWIDGITCFSAASFFIFAIRKWKDNPDLTMSKEEMQEESSGELPPHKNSKFLWFLFATLLMGWAFIQWFHTVPVLIKREWGFDERIIGALMAVSCVIIVLAEMPIIDQIERKKKIYRYYMAGVFIIGLSYLAFLSVPLLWICYLAVILWTIGELFHLPLNMSLAMTMSPDSKRGQYMGWYFMCWSSTAIIGPLLGFWIIDKIGFHWFWVILFGACLISLLINYSIRSSLKN